MAAEERANPNTHINTKMNTKKKKNTQSKDKIRNPIRRGLEAVRLGAGGCKREGKSKYAYKYKDEY